MTLPRWAAGPLVTLVCALVAVIYIALTFALLLFRRGERSIGLSCANHENAIRRAEVLDESFNAVQLPAGR